VPAYSFLTGGDPANDAAVGAAYASHLQAKSEAAVDALLDLTLPDGSPVAIEFDTGSYFLCSVVQPTCGSLARAPIRCRISCGSQMVSGAGGKN
jgi:hypothetical protein